MKKFIIYLTIAILAVSTASLSVAAATTDNLSKQKQTIDSKINDISKKQQEEKKQLKELESQKNKIVTSSKKENEVYTGLQKQKNELEKQVEELNLAVEESEKRYNGQKEILKKRIVLMYENNDKSNFRTILRSKSFSNVFERLEIMAIISSNDKQLIDSIILDKKDVEYKKQQKEKIKLQVENKANDSLRSIKKLLASRANVETEMKRINSTLKLLEKQEDELIEKSEELDAYINSQVSKGKYSGGNMVWPTPSSKMVTSHYGNRYHPIFRNYKFHSGIDIGASFGTSILAANSGKVIISGWQSGYGNTIVIDHGGGISTLYGHCNKLLVSKGDKIKAGQLIAKVGSTGNSTGPHLHFEIRRKGSTVNPLAYVK